MKTEANKERENKTNKNKKKKEAEAEKDKERDRKLRKILDIINEMRNRDLVKEKFNFLLLV